MAEPAARESYTPSHNAASDALCMLHTLAMIRKITGGGGGGRGGEKGTLPATSFSFLKHKSENFAY